MAREKDDNRIERLERLAEEMFAGIAQLRGSQAKTDDQIRELRESQAKTDEQMRRTDAKLDRIGKQLGDLGLVQNPLHLGRRTCQPPETRSGLRLQIPQSDAPNSPVQFTKQDLTPDLVTEGDFAP